MGIRLAWMAVRGVGKATLLERLGYVETGETGDWHEVVPAFTERPGGWGVLLVEEGELPEREALEALSQEAEVITCEISETVMYSETQGFSGGRLAWRVVHDGGSKGVYDLTVQGQPPEPFEATRARIVTEQDEKGGEKAGADYVFDLPADFVYALTGFRANGSPMEDEPVMAELERFAPAQGRASSKAERRPGFLARLFGRG